MSLSEDHKAKLDAGRRQGQAVRRYLEALETNRPKRGRKRTTDSVQRQLADLETKMAEASAIQKLRLIQTRLDLQNELDRLSSAVDMDEVTDSFVAVARDYGEAKGISYDAWREIGVPADVLKRAGIK